MLILFSVPGNALSSSLLARGTCSAGGTDTIIAGKFKASPALSAV